LKRPRYNFDSDESADRNAARSNVLSIDEHHEDQHLDGGNSNSAVTDRKKLRGRNSSATNSNSNSNSSNSRSLNLNSPNRSSLRNNRSGGSNVVVDIEVVQTTARTTPSSTVGGGMTLDDISSDNEQHVSISSRGRVRKITAKARGLFRE